MKFEPSVTEIIGYLNEVGQADRASYGLNRIAIIRGFGITYGY